MYVYFVGYTYITVHVFTLHFLHETTQY